MRLGHRLEGIDAVHDRSEGACLDVLEQLGKLVAPPMVEPRIERLLKNTGRKSVLIS